MTTWQTLKTSTLVRAGASITTLVAVAALVGAGEKWI
jgi:hypothetical protein